MHETLTPSTQIAQSGQTSRIDHGEALVAARPAVASAARTRASGWRLGWRGAAMICLALAVTVGSFGLGWWGAVADDDAGFPAEGSADAGFLRDMIVHHDQAVSMAFLMRDRSTDNLMDAIATDIILGQLVQIGMMRGYLSVWDLPATPPAGAPPPMAWMDHPVQGLMPGMATPEELTAVRILPLAEAEVLFLRLMIRHHASGIEMAQAGLARVETRQARELAEAVIPVQFNEIQLMQQELQVRGEAAEPVLDASGMGDMGDMDARPGHEMGTPTPG